MSDGSTQHADLAVRASDAEREQTVALLQRNFADGRLTQAELEERASAAYAARTRAQLRDLTADLPDAEEQPARPDMIFDRRVLCILLCVCPPAGVAYWLLYLSAKQATAGPEPPQRPSAERAAMRARRAQPGAAQDRTRPRCG